MFEKKKKTLWILMNMNILQSFTICYDPVICTIWLWAPLSHFLCKLLTSTLLCNIFVNTVWVVIPSPGIFLTQGLNLGLLHCRLSHQKCPCDRQCTKMRNIITRTMDAGLRKGGQRDSLRDTFQKCVRAIKKGRDRGRCRRVDHSPLGELIYMQVLHSRGGNKTFFLWSYVSL